MELTTIRITNNLWQLQNNSYQLQTGMLSRARARVRARGKDDLPAAQEFLDNSEWN